jgi:hypothetical protein
MMIDLNSPGGNIHSKNRIVLDATLSLLESCFYRKQDKFLSDLFKDYSTKVKIQ